MFKFTSSMLKKAAVLCFIGSGLIANAANEFVYNGIIYTPSGTKLTAKPYTTKVGGVQVLTEPYSGDVVIESPVTIDGVTYTVTSVSNAFKGSNITSLYLPDDCITVSRGGLSECKYLTSVRLSPNMTTMPGNCFQKDSALVELSIPGGITQLKSNELLGCISLKKLVLEEGSSTITFNISAFGSERSCPIEELVINRNVSAEAVASTPIRGLASLKKVTIGGACTAVPTSYFENCTALETVEIGTSVTEMGTSAFANTAIASINIHGGIATIPVSCFKNCTKLTEVILNDGTTTISEMAFQNSPVAAVTLPATLTGINTMAFSGCNLTGDIVIPAQVTKIANEAFAGNAAITSVSFPASLTNLGEGVFNGCNAITAFSVDAANTAYVVKDNKALATIDGATILAYPVAAPETTFTDAVAKAIGAYAFNGAKNITAFDVPIVTAFGDYALANTGVQKMTIRGEVGRYVLSGNTALTSVHLASGTQTPHGLCKDCSSLTEFTSQYQLMTIKSESFAGCTSLKTLDLGGLLSIIEADAFKGAGIETFINGSVTPAAMAEGVFTEANSAIVVKVPISATETYKAAAGWKYLTIEGDANIAATGTTLSMPNGLYYAGKDGMLYCVTADGLSTTYDVGTALHTFQLLEFKNRIYGASAGKNFCYENTPIGDGKLFYISQLDGNTFQATVLDNAGENAYKDPFALYIYGDTLYVSDRNVAVRKVSADAIALPASYPSWVENNWLGWYGAPWAYGCVKSGFQITQDADNTPLYWVGMRYNGNGIYRFKEEHVGSAAGAGTKPDYSAIFNSAAVNFSTFYIDEKNDHLYIYIVKASNDWASGLYRFKFSDVLANPDPSDLSTLNPVLVDGAPILLEGSKDSQETGITQLAVDENGEYMYWCYISAGQGTAAGTPAEAYNAENPMHQSGIKRIKLGEETPTLEMVVAGVEGYGLVVVDYAGSAVESIVAEKNVNDRIQVIGNSVTVLEDAAVSIYNTAGVLVAQTATNGVETVSLNDLNTGVYIVKAVFADGAKQVVKVVK